METDWLGDKVPFHPRKYFWNNITLCDLLRNDPVRVTMPKSFLDQTSGHYINNIYDINDPDVFADSLTHLLIAQRDNLQKVLKD